MDIQIMCAAVTPEGRRYESTVQSYNFPAEVPLCDAVDFVERQFEKEAGRPWNEIQGFYIKW